MNYTKQIVRHKLATDIRWVERALVRLFERQTEYEKSANQTTNKNFVGFQTCDARMYSSFAKYILRGNHLTEKQFKYCLRNWRGRPSICKYAGQVLEMIETGR